MATVVNTRSVFLANASPRLLPPANAGISLTATTPTFHVDNANNVTPAAITITAQLIGIVGTVTFSATGCTLSSVSGNTVQITSAGMTTSAAVVTASILYRGQTFTATYGVSKVFDGAQGPTGPQGVIGLTGAPAAYVVVSTPAQAFTRATSAASFAPSSITLTATPYGGTATYQWQYWTGSAWTNVASTSATYAVASGDFTDARTYRVQATINGTTYTDQITLVQLTGGSNGVNSINGYLTNEATTFAADSAGNVATYAPSAGTFKVFDGITEKTGAAVAYSVPSQTNCTVTINGAGVYSAGSMSADTATAVLQAFYGGVTIQKVLSLSKSRAGNLGANGFYPPVEDASWVGGFAPTVTDGQVGPNVRRNSASGVYETVSHPKLTPIDRTRSYRVRFWARAAAGTNGVLYHDLRQFTDAAGTPSASNGGRDPYQPSNQAAHTDWRQYDYLWDSTKWQSGTTHVAPDFLLNYQGTAGYWEVQGYTMIDATEAVKAQAAADAANAAIANISSDNVLSKGEKIAVRKEYETIDAEWATIIIQADALGVDRFAYNNAHQNLGSYLVSLGPNGEWYDSSKDTAIDGAVFRQKFTDCYNTKQALLNAISAKAATMANADGLNVTIGGDNLAYNSSFERMANGLADGYNIYNNDPTNEPASASSTVGRTGGLAQVISWSGNHYNTKGINGPICKPGWVANKTYMISIWAKSSSLASGGNMFLAWNTTPTSVVIVTNPYLSGDWQRYSWRITWGASVEASGNGFISVSTGTGGGNVILDDLMVVEGDVLPAYYPSAAEAATLSTWMGTTGTGKPADNASSDIALVGRGVTVIGNTAEKTSGSSGWDADCYSTVAYTGAAAASAVPVSNGIYTDLMFGLNADPLTNTSWDTLDYAIRAQNDGSLLWYESGGGGGTLGTFSYGDVLQVEYDGSQVRYLRSGTVLRAVVAPAGLKLYFDSSFNTNGSKLTNIRFSPMSSNNWASVGGNGKPADNATVSAADAATSLGFNPQFSDWPTGQTYPTGWSSWTGASPTRETGTVTTPPNAVKYVVAGDGGMLRTYTWDNFPLPAGDFLTGSFDAYIVNNNGGTGQPGYLIRLYTAPSGGGIVDTIVPVTRNDVSGWQRVNFTATVPAGARIYGMTIYQMAAWSGMPGGSWSNGSIVVFDNLMFNFNRAVAQTQLDTALSNAINAGAAANAALSNPVQITQLGSQAVGLTHNNFNQSAGTYTATVTAGTAPYKYSWSVDGGNPIVSLWITGGSSGSYVSLLTKCNTAGTNIDFYINCTVTDAKGFSATMTFNLNVDFT